MAFRYVLMKDGQRIIRVIHNVLAENVLKTYYLSKFQLVVHCKSSWHSRSNNPAKSPSLEFISWLTLCCTVIFSFSLINKAQWMLQSFHVLVNWCIYKYRSARSADLSFEHHILDVCLFVLSLRLAATDRFQMKGKTLTLTMKGCRNVVFPWEHCADTVTHYRYGSCILLGSWVINNNKKAHLNNLWVFVSL